MNTVKCAKSTALDKMCNPSCDPTKHRKGIFHRKEPKRGLSGTCNEKFSA